ncbi:IPTL-CTERM sorting domain-containing protein [Pseudorhodoferax sp.]|uniref:IPTL-CTERM sorting domain-containing protein n=1 Tax=Pseudorhodoferax sp. TaxID=1993553 RepID=UPI002DD668A8|nr:IPTL-CTERM sorting domain-containing protein [Pseudorhodoferax sp.]
MTGTGVRGPQFAEALVSTDLQYSDGRRYSDLPTLLLCVDVTTALPPDGPIAYTDGAGASALRGGSGAAGIAAIHWLFDQYYAVYFKNGSSQQQWAFQYAVWELGNDFNGTVGSLNTGVGASRPAVDGYFSADPDFIAAYQAMYQAMVAALPGLASSYRSQTYTLDLFKSTDPAQQDMVALVERAPPVVAAPTPIPTLGPWALVLLSALIGAGSWRRLGRSRLG